MKHLYLSILLIVLCLAPCAAEESAFRDISMEEVQAAFNRPTLSHPRLLMTDKQVTRIRAELKSQSSISVPPIVSHTNAPIFKELKKKCWPRPLSQIGIQAISSMWRR
jgi:hypothetical protein